MDTDSMELDAVLELVAADSPLLVRFRATRTRGFDDSALDRFSTALRTNNHLKSLLLAGSAVTPEGVAAHLVPVIPLCGLEMVDVWGFRGMSTTPQCRHCGQCEGCVQRQAKAALRAMTPQLTQLCTRNKCKPILNNDPGVTQLNVKMDEAPYEWRMVSALRGNTHVKCIEFDFVITDDLMTATLGSSIGRAELREAMNQAMPHSAVEKVTCTAGQPSGIYYYQRAGAEHLQPLCRANRLSRESTEQSRPLQRLLVAALYGGMSDLLSLNADVMTLVVAHLACSRLNQLKCSVLSAEGWNSEVAWTPALVQQWRSVEPLYDEDLAWHTGEGFGRRKRKSRT